jgi:hypothetical protein
VQRDYFLFKKSFRSHLLFFLFGVINCFWLQRAQAQTLNNTFSSFDGNQVTIFYDLVYSDTSQLFFVEIFSSADQFARPLSFASGAVGNRVKAGRLQKIVWDVRKALPSDFDQEISYKLKVTLLLPGQTTVPIQSQTTQAVVPSLAKAVSLIAPASCRRGKLLKVSVAGANPGDQLVYELIDPQKTTTTLGSTSGTSPVLNWPVPVSLPSGRYTIRLVSNGNTAESIALPIKIKHKIPLVVKALPAVVAGAVLIVLSGKKTGDSTLPGPINPN